MKSVPTALAEAVGPQLPIFTFYSGGVLFKDPELDTQLARHFAEEIVSIHPEGPYRLGGNCKGAGIILRTADYVAEMGGRIAGLCLLEYFDPSLYAAPYRLQLLYGRESSLKAYTPFGWPGDGWWKSFRVRPEVYWVRGAHGEFFLPANIGDVAYRIKTFFSMEVVEKT